MNSYQDNRKAPLAPSGRERAQRAVLAASLILLGACRDEAGPEPAPASAPVPADPALIEANNKGVGLMGRFDYDAAQSAFADLVERAPEWTDARINLAIATLNRQQPGDEAAALVMLEEIIAAAPGNLRARYMAGLLQFNQGRTAEALTHFQFVAEADPDDAYARYYVGQALLQQGDAPGALANFEAAAAIDPYLRSAHYGAFLAHQRSRNPERARAYLRQYQRLETNPRSRLAEIKYTRMGPKAEALAVRADPAPQRVASNPPSGDLFGAPVSLIDLTDATSAAALIEADRRWLLISSPVGVRWCDLDRSCAGGEAPPFAGQAAVLAAAWGDLDNDGRTDLYLARAGENQLWRESDDGRWTDVTAASGIGGGEFETVAALLLDADHDGDLDVFLVQADGPNELLNNNGDGSFRPLAADLGLQGEGVATGALAADLDGDRDTDLVVLNQKPPHEVYLNDRLWAYHRGAGFESFVDAPLVAAAAVDADADGRVELYGLGPAGELSQWQSQADGWERLALSAARVGRPTMLWPADFDGDGGYELLIAGAERWSLARLAGDEQPLSSGDGRVIAVANAVAERGPGLVVAGAGGVEFHPPGPGRFPFVALRFSGREDPGQSMRSNVSGIGTDYVIRSGSLWFAGSTLPARTAASQALQPELVGLGGRERVDYVAIDWSDGVFQTELALEPGRLHALVETQRQLASCPVVFAWDGERFRFVSDVLGVGGIGFNLGFGEYSEPRPWENFLLPAGLLAARDGMLEIKIAEPMEEIAYLDRARLVAYDLPPGVELALDERLAVNGPAPSGDPVAYRQVLRPQAAVNRAGIDVTQELAEADLQAAPLPGLDRRFVGLLAEEQKLIIDFGVDLAGLREPALLMDGWVEYGYSQTSFAAWQAGRRYRSATLEVQSNGQWQELIAEFGYPAGMPRMALLRLPALPPGTVKLRLTTNQQIYWDALAVVDLIEDPALQARPAPLVAARMEHVGFPRRRNGPQMQPHYDFADRQPFWDVRYPAGFYTALGPATELVTALDNALAIVGPGDALSLRFEAPPPPAPGWRRRWVLKLDGWAKDMDLYTRDGQTVAPLPSRTVPADRAAVLHPRYNTRYQSGI